MSEQSTSDLLKRHQDYVARCKAGGCEFIEYKCPACKTAIETHRPTEGRKFSSMATCPHCGALHLYVTHHDHVDVYSEKDWEARHEAV